VDWPRRWAGWKYAGELLESSQRAAREQPRGARFAAQINPCCASWATITQPGRLKLKLKQQLLAWCLRAARTLGQRKQVAATLP